jgi:hypothetical protein
MLLNFKIKERIMEQLGRKYKSLAKAEIVRLAFDLTTVTSNFRRWKSSTLSLLRERM